MERTLVLLKPCAVERALIGEITSRFERKGLYLVGMKLNWLDDKVLTEHYGHLVGKPFFPGLVASMSSAPVVVMCWEGLDAVSVVRTIVGPTNARLAPAGTIRGDFSMSFQENVVHASDSLETAAIEIKRFFRPEELFDYQPKSLQTIYSKDEI